MKGLKGIRLFSCSDWQGGKVLAHYIDQDIPVYASNRKVNLYFDENEKLISIDGGQWKKSTKTEESTVNPDWDKGPQAKGMVVQMSDFPPNVQQKIQNLTPEEFKAFKNDYADAKFKKAIDKNPELVEGWKVLHEAGETVLRKDIGELQKVLNDLVNVKKIGYGKWKVKSLLSSNAYKELDDLLTAGKISEVEFAAFAKELRQNPSLVNKVNQSGRPVGEIKKWVNGHRTANDPDLIACKIFDEDKFASGGKNYTHQVTSDGKIHITSDRGRSYVDKVVTVDFVITADGTLKIGKRHGFLADEFPVKGAGELIVVNGQVKGFINKSGHFKPTSAELQRMFSEFKDDLKVDLSEAKVFDMTRNRELMEVNKAAYERMLKKEGWKDIPHDVLEHPNLDKVFREAQQIGRDLGKDAEKAVAKDLIDNSLYRKQVFDNPSLLQQRKELEELFTTNKFEDDLLKAEKFYQDNLKPHLSDAIKNTSLVDREAGLIHDYSKTNYREVNEIIRNPAITETREITLYKNALNRALDKLPPYQGVCYRGANGGYKIQDFVVGKPFSDKAFMSTTYLAEKSNGFGSQFSFKIMSKTGRKIEEISYFGSIRRGGRRNEYEVLFKTDTQFIVQKVEPKGTTPSGEQKWYIELIEQ